MSSFNPQPGHSVVENYTQIHSTADRINTEMTAQPVATTAAMAIAPWGYSQAQANSIVSSINALVADVDGVKQVLNAIIDDLRAAKIVG